MPDLVARPPSPTALSDLLDRKPYLLRALAAQVLPPPLGAIDPAERLGIDLSSLRNAEDARQVLCAVLAAVSRGDIAPAEAARIARRVRSRLRAARRLDRQLRQLARGLARITGPVRLSLGWGWRVGRKSAAHSTTSAAVGGAPVTRPAVAG